MGKHKKLKKPTNYFSICITMSIVLVVLSMFCYVLFSKNAQNAVDSNLKYFTQQSFYLIEERLALIEKKIVEVSSDERIKSFVGRDKSKTDVLERANVVSEISNHTTGETYIRSIFVYNKKEDYVISDSGYSNKLDMFLEYILEVQQGKREAMKKNLLDIADITVVKYDKIFKNSSFLVLAPMYDKELSKKCVVGVIVEAHFLEDILERLKINSQCVLLLTNDFGEIITASSEELLKSGVFENEKNDKVYLGSVKYNIFCSTSDKYKIKYYNFIPHDIMNDDYMAVRGAIIIIIAISLILLMILLILFSKKNYRILNAFITRMRDMNPDIEGEEAEYIDAALGGLYEEEKRINKLIEENYEIIREGIIRQLISGNTVNENKDEKLMEYLDFDIEEGYKRTSIFVFDEEKSAKDFVGIIGERFPQGVLSIYDENIVTVIFINKTYEQINTLIKSGMSALRRAGIGNAYINPDDIGKSYKEAKQALGFVCVKEDERIFVYEKIREAGGSLEKIKWDYKPFIDKLILGEGIAAVELLRQKTQELFKERVYIKEDDLKELFLGIKNSIKKAFKLPENENIYGESDLSLTSFYELKDMTEKYLLWVGEFLMKKDINVNQYNRVIEYIHSQNGFNFDLNQIAFELDINPSYLSRWFKEYTGETYTDYTKRLKINEVKRLLIESELPLKEIALRVNYSSSSVLAKVFKKETGMTLKTFREKGKSEKE